MGERFLDHVEPMALPLAGFPPQIQEPVVDGVATT